MSKKYKIGGKICQKDKKIQCKICKKIKKLRIKSTIILEVKWQRVKSKSFLKFGDKMHQINLLGIKCTKN